VILQKLSRRADRNAVVDAKGKQVGVAADDDTGTAADGEL
jgi:hypothetical protein